ncbi:MAG: glycosyl hydrolase 53 family protein [Clostridia bacterium]|nr:glycosyl hydrolase 53 family protein [Clostridia bacterium]
MKEFIKGADVSSLLEVEENGGKFYCGGKPGDALEILRDHGINLVRLRLWNDPYDENGNPYGAGTNGIERTIELFRRAKNCNMKLMLDFHYSDFWADPGKQFLPKAWRGHGANELENDVYEFTKSTLQRLKTEDLSPDYVAVGNEITNGLLWPEGKVPNYKNIARFVSAGVRAVREMLPSSMVVIHLDNGGNNALYREWFDNYISNGGEDFDMIGLSYYPFWHGTPEDLKNNLFDISSRYSKELIVVETSMGFTLEDYRSREELDRIKSKGLVANEELAAKVDYPMTKQGQAAFICDLAKIIRSVPNNKGLGFVWWEPTWIPAGSTGWAADAGLRYIGEEGPGGNEWANQALFDYRGNSLPALDEIAKI